MPEVFKNNFLQLAGIKTSQRNLIAFFDSQYWREKKQVRGFEIKHGQRNKKN